MKRFSGPVCTIAIAATLWSALTPVPVPAAELDTTDLDGRTAVTFEGATVGGADSVILAQAEATQDGALTPRYEPAPPAETGSWSNAYVFAASRGLADSTLHPAVRAPLFLLTIPLDIVLLPFAMVGGLFGAE